MIQYHYFTNLVKHFIKIYEFNNQLFSKLNSKPYLSYEWTMKMKKKAHESKYNYHLMTSLSRKLISKGIIGLTKLPLIIGRTNKWKIIEKFSS
jgi:nicotinamide riboside transporter PnuC